MKHPAKIPHKKESSLEEKPRTSISPIFQAIFIGINFLATAGLLYKETTKFDPQEPLPEVSPVTPEIIKKFGGFADIVMVGLSIDRFDNFNMTAKDFTFDGILWFTLDPGTISIQTLDKFSFENGTILQRSEPTLQLTNNKLTVRYSVRVKFSSELDYSNFPLDTHRITLLLVNRFVSPREMNFDTEDFDFKITADVSTTGWDEVDRAVNTGYIQRELDPGNPSLNLNYPAVTFEIDYMRNSVRYALTILLPLALIFYVMLFSISLPLTTAISITAGGITGILAYRFVIENLSPRTGYFMLSDHLFFMFLSATIFVFIINIAETSITLSSWVKKSLIILLHVLMLTTTICLFLFW